MFRVCIYTQHSCRQTLPYAEDTLSSTHQSVYHIRECLYLTFNTLSILIINYFEYNYDSMINTEFMLESFQVNSVSTRKFSKNKVHVFPTLKIFSKNIVEIYPC